LPLAPEGMEPQAPKKTSSTPVSPFSF